MRRFVRGRWLSVVAALFTLLAGGISTTAAADWPAAFARMPLPANSPPLSRSNAVRLILENFRSNDVVKGIVILPGVADDFYLIHRDQPIAARVTNLAQAIAAVTNLTPVRVVFTNGLLLLQTDLDRPQGLAIPDPERWPLSKTHPATPPMMWIDAHWRTVQPALKKALGVTVRPAASSEDAWHFERVNLATHGLTPGELVAAVTLATGTRATVEKRTVMFERPSR